VKVLRIKGRPWIWIFIVPLFFFATQEAFAQPATMEFFAGHFFSPVIGATHRHDLNYAAFAVRYEFLRPFKSVPILMEATYTRTT